MIRNLIFCAFTLVSALSSGVAAEESTGPYVQVATIVIDPAHIEAYQAAAREQIEAAIRDEPGVLALYSVYDNKDPTRVTVFEIYKDMAAYRSHLGTIHFKKYKVVTEKMVTSLTLVPATPILLGAKHQP